MFGKIREIIKTKLTKKRSRAEGNKKEQQLQNERIDILQKSIDRLTEILQNMNLHDLVYILGSKKEIIRRNIIAGIARGIGSRYRFYYYNSNNNIFLTKNCEIKHTNNR